MKLTVEPILKYSPVITAMVIIAGITRSIFYFYFFDIRILPFLELSECLLMFLDNILLIVFLTLIMAGGFWALERYERYLNSSIPDNFPKAKSIYIFIVRNVIFLILPAIIIPQFLLELSDRGWYYAFYYAGVAISFAAIILTVYLIPKQSGTTRLTAFFSICLRYTWKQTFGICFPLYSVAVLLPEVKHLYELQNIYFSLKGEEMSIKIL